MLRECIDSTISAPYVHDGAYVAAGSYGAQAYIGRNIIIERVRTRKCRNTLDFHAVYCGHIRDVDGWDSNGIGLMHNGFGGNIIVERCRLVVHGDNYGIATNPQGRNDAATKMIARDITIRDIKFVTDRKEAVGNNFTGVYIQQSWANLLIENISISTATTSTPPTGIAHVTAVRLNGYPAGPTIIRNVQQEGTANLAIDLQAVGTLVIIVGNAGGLSRAHWPIIIEDCHGYYCHSVVLARGVKHLVTKNLTASDLRGGNVKIIESLNGITNVTNQSIGLHGVYL